MQKPIVLDVMFSKKTSCGFEIPSLGIGTWEMGGRHSKDDNNDRKEIDAIRFTLDKNSISSYSHPLFKEMMHKYEKTPAQIAII